MDGEGRLSELKLVPVTLAEAREFIGKHHRHNRPPQGWRFGVGLMNGTGELRGVAVAGHPIARALDDGRTIEITRVATDGYKNANSKLYGAILRAAKALGYQTAVTYTLDSEAGSSVKAVGFKEVARVPGHRDWTHSGREAMYTPVLFGNKYPKHEGEKIRWEKEL